MGKFEFSAKGGVFDMNAFINACDAAACGETPEEQSAPPAEAPAPAPVAEEVPVACI